MEEKIRYLVEERFDTWRQMEFAPIQQHCVESKETMKDTGMKIDAVWGETHQNSKEIARHGGILWVVLAVMIILLGVVVKNGGVH